MTGVKTSRNFTEGPLFVRMFIYAIPIMLTGILQMLYNMADHIVVSQYSGDNTALAAIGSTSSLINLVIGLLMGIGGGAAVVIAQLIGAQRRDEVSRASHTAMLFSFLGGIFIMCLGLLISEPILALMGTKTEIFAGARLYFRIICLGFPASAMFNFGAAILRAAGDSRMPLYILATSGIVNVLLNLVFVVLFNMTVDGVALATVISQYLSAAGILFILIRRKSEDYSISPRRLSLDRRLLFRILRLGIPAGIQSCLFSLSNVILTSAVNQFDTVTITAKTIQGNIDAFTYTVMTAYFQTVLTFTGQNYGADKPDRVKKTLFYGLFQVVAVGIIVSRLEILFIEPLCSLFIEGGSLGYDLIMHEAKEATVFMLKVYFLCGVMEVLSAALRGLGYSIAPMLTVLIGACGLRVAWIYLVFPDERFHTLKGLLTCYPVTWTITCLALSVLLTVALIKLSKKKKINL